MSESDKMGLFGSKDENNESIGEEKKNADERVGSSADRYAPYNIDSDSETYDTEALSIMDINDIIGIQADTAGDSTLESEFAALSEIITDSKGEYASPDESLSPTRENLTSSDDTRKTATVNESGKEDAAEQETAAAENAQSPVDVSSFNKSLRLIGEAYISEDSQGTDNEDVEKSAAKKSNAPNEPKAPEPVGDMGKNAKEAKEDVDKAFSKPLKTFESKVAEAESAEPIDRNEAKVADAEIAEPIERNEAKVAEAEMPQPIEKNEAMVAEADMPEPIGRNEAKAAEAEAENANPIETIDAEVTKCVLKAPTVETARDEESKVNAVSDPENAQPSTPCGSTEIIESADSTDAAIVDVPGRPGDEDFEQMDVDSVVSIEQLDKSEGIAGMAEILNKDKDFQEDAKLPVSEEAKLTIEPKATEEPMEVDEEPSKIFDKPPMHVSSRKEDKSDPESSDVNAALASPIPETSVDKECIEEESREVSSSADPECIKEVPITHPEPEVAFEDKDELQRAANPKDEKTESEKPNEHEELPTDEKSSSKENANPEKPVATDVRSEFSEESIREPSIGIVQEESQPRDEGTKFSMQNREVDAQVDTESSKNAEKIEGVDETFEKPEVAIERMEIDELDEQEILDDKPGNVLSSETEKLAQSVTSVSDNNLVNKPEVVEETLETTTKSPDLKETPNTEIQCENLNSTENSNDNAAPALDACEKSLEIVGHPLPRSPGSVPCPESLAQSAEDEKMEVDGSAKIVKEIKVFGNLASLQSIEKMIATVEIGEMTISEELSIDTVDVAPVTSPEVERTRTILEKSEPGEVSSTESPEIIPAECSIEMAEENQVAEDENRKTSKGKEETCVKDTAIDELSNAEPAKDQADINEIEKEIKEEDGIFKKKDTIDEKEEIIVEKEEIIDEEKKDTIDEKQNIVEQREDAPENVKDIPKRQDPTKANENHLPNKEETEAQVSAPASQPPTDKNSVLEKPGSPGPQKISLKIAKIKTEEKLPNETESDSSCTAAMETTVTAEVELSPESTVEEKEKLVSSEKTEESQEVASEDQVVHAEKSHHNEMDISNELMLKDEKRETEDLLLAGNTESPDGEGIKISSESAELSNEANKHDERCSEEIEMCSVVTEEDRKKIKESAAPVAPEKTFNEELECVASPRKADTAIEETNATSPEETESSNNMDTSSSPRESHASETIMKLHSPETSNLPEQRVSENSNLPHQEALREEMGADECSEKNEHQEKESSEEESEEKEGKMESISSEVCLPCGGKNIPQKPETSKNEERISMAPETGTSIEDKENLATAESSECLNSEVELVANYSETALSPEIEDKDSTTSLAKVDHPVREKEESVCSATSENEREVAKTQKEVSAATRESNECPESKDSDEEFSVLIRETAKETGDTETSEPEEKDSSKVKIPATNSVSFVAKEQCDEESKVSADTSSVEKPPDSVSAARESPQLIYVDRDMEIENKAETIESSLTGVNETNLARSNDYLVSSSTYKTDEARVVEREKCIADSVDNLKDILSTDGVCVSQMFQDDEQSQSTQEMMESILETDKGNLNKILDDQEVDDLEESSTINGMEKLSKESENMLNKALEDPMGATNIDSLEGLLDLDLMPENDEANLKSVQPIVDKVMRESCDEIETIGKNVDVDLLMEVNDAIVTPNRSGDYDARIATEIIDDTRVIATVDELIDKSAIQDDRELADNSDLTEKDLEAFDLASVVANPLDNVDPSEETKINLAEDLLREIAVDEERNMELTEKLLLEDDMQGRDLLLSATVAEPTKIDMSDEVFLPVEGERDMELSEDISLDSAVRDQVLNDVAAEMENLPPNSEISELESAVKFLQESEEQDIDSPLVLSPKMVEDVVDDIVEGSGVGIFAGEADICEDHSELVAELESIIPDPIAISEAEIINEAAKLEIERKTKLSEASKLPSPIEAKMETEEIERNESSLAAPTTLAYPIEESKFPEDSSETVAAIAKSPEVEKIEREPLLKSAPIPKISILEERLKIPPKIEIPVGEPTRICDLPTTPKTSLLIQRDARATNLTKQLESPKSVEKRDDHRIVDTPRKDSEKHDFENVGSPRIILKIAKSAIADCSEPRSPKSPKIRSATNSPNPEDSPGQKLGKIKLKLSKSGHPSIISNDNFEEQCGQWHTEGSSSLSPLGMKIKFSKISDGSGSQTEKHESEETREQTTGKHKFEEAKRTDSPLGMKIKLSRTGEPSIVQQEGKETPTGKHKEKFDAQQHSPKRTESSIGMKIKLSKSGDASIIQPDKQEIVDEHREPSTRIKEKLDASQQQQQQYGDRSDTTRRTESPLGMKFKLFKTGDASIVPAETAEDAQPDVKRTDSPLGKKTKPMKTRSATAIANSELNDDGKDKLEIPEAPRRTESPLGMKIKLSKRGGDASIIHNDEARESSKARSELPPETEGSSAVKIKVGKTLATGQPDVIHETEAIGETLKRSDAMIGVKIKLSKSGDASIVHPERDESNIERSEIRQENARKVDTPIGVKIKLLRSGDASIIQSQPSEKMNEQTSSTDTSRETESSRVHESPTVAKAKTPKCTEAGSVEASEKREKSSRRKDTEMPIEMKIKLSRTGHPTIVACDNYADTQRGKESPLEITSPVGTSKQSPSSRENAGMKMLKSMHAAANLHGNRSELTIEPIQLQTRKSSELIVDDSVAKRKDITISPIESKKAKHETKLSHILPEVTIQPIVPREASKQQIVFENKAGSISRQQMNVISQEISITQVRSSKPMDLTMNDKLKSILTHSPTIASSDCEIIEHRPELIIVNENSNSSQDVMIIEEVPAIRGPENKVPKKRGRPRRNPLPIILAKPTSNTAPPPPNAEPIVPRDPLALDDVAHIMPHMVPQIFPPAEAETHGRPKRTCRNQKSYAPPKRGRGRGGRGKRKMDVNTDLSKKPRMEQDLELIERPSTALITIHEPPSDMIHSANEASPGPSCNTSELYKALRQPTMDRKLPNAIARNEIEQAVNDTRNDPAKMTRDHLGSLMDARLMSHLDGVISTSINKATCDESFEKERKLLLVDIIGSEKQKTIDLMPQVVEKAELSTVLDDKIIANIVQHAKANKDPASTMDHENWLAPSSKKQCDVRNEANISNVQVMDEETRMSAESGSRSQTPAKNMSSQAPETIVNEESQGSVLSTATTESEKVKVKNRRMEIHFDPDEGPFTVDKVAEYDWPLDPTKKNETFMIQEQISHYLGVKSFKRKYPDLKRRMVDMEERNYLRENGLVSEAMCDMGLTAVLSSEVLDIMCSDFPDQYEEYRKHIREKQMKEHFKKQKELTAAANAEKNRIDLAEMAVQSALSWNIGLNKARRESRKCSLDLQTFTIHVPKKQQKVEEESGTNHYPVALIPGQYTDYYREYTPAELRYYPLNTVLYGPMRPNERKFDSQSEGSQSESDTDSSSDDSSSSSSEGTQDTEASQSTMDDVDAELSRQKEDIKSIKCKMCLKHLNKFSRSEVLIQCGTCNGYVHPSCIDLTLDMVPHIQAYAWQCTDCKTCAQCHDPADEDKMLFCDMCDRGYHIYCVGLRRVPQGRWHCQECAVCASCGSREAGGTNSDRNSVAQWQHEYKKGDKNTRVYVSTLCVPCSKLWRKGRYCPHCSRCHTVPRLDLEVNLVHCSACDKYLHLGCVETKDLIVDRKNYRCDFCQPLRHHMVKPLVSKVFKT